LGRGRSKDSLESPQSRWRKIKAHSWHLCIGVELNGLKEGEEGKARVQARGCFLPLTLHWNGSGTAHKTNKLSNNQLRLTMERSASFSLNCNSLLRLHLLFVSSRLEQPRPASNDSQMYSWMLCYCSRRCSLQKSTAQWNRDEFAQEHSLPPRWISQLSAYSTLSANTVLRITSDDEDGSKVISGIREDSIDEGQRGKLRRLAVSFESLVATFIDDEIGTDVWDARRARVYEQEKETRYVFLKVLYENLGTKREDKAREGSESTDWKLLRGSRSGGRKVNGLEGQTHWRSDRESGK